MEIREKTEYFDEEIVGKAGRGRSSASLFPVLPHPSPPEINVGNEPFFFRSGASLDFPFYVSPFSLHPYYSGI